MNVETTRKLVPRLRACGLVWLNALAIVACGQAEDAAKGDDQVVAPGPTEPAAGGAPAGLATDDAPAVAVAPGVGGAGPGIAPSPTPVPPGVPSEQPAAQPTLGGTAQPPTTTSPPAEPVAPVATEPTMPAPPSTVAPTDPTGPVPEPAPAPVAGTLELTGLVIEPNPNSVLSAYVSWTTATAATSVVQFGIGEYVWEISDDEAVTEHRVLVIGMRAAETYQLKAMSSNDSGAGEATGTFDTGELPPGVPVGEVSSYDPELSQPGWTLMNVQLGQGDYRARSDLPPIAVIYDEEGQPVWYVISGDSPDIGGAVSTQLTDVGVLVGPQMQGAASPREWDFAGNLAWECDDARCGGTSDLSHHAGKLPNGHIVYNRDVAVGSVTMPVFEELEPPGNEKVWQLDLATVLPPTQSASGDWCHGNSVTVKADQNEVYASCRFLGVIKTTYDNPTLIWHLPAAYGASGMGDFTYDPPESQFSDIHDPEIHDDGTVMVFDNGGWSGQLGEYNPTNLHSRVVEYSLDEASGVATRTWEFPGDFEVDAWYRDSWYEPFWGDADRLANRNVLMTGGMKGPNLRSRVFEATDDGQLVWVMELPADYGLYRAERITPPLVHRIE